MLNVCPARTFTGPVVDDTTKSGLVHVKPDAGPGPDPSIEFTLNCDVVVAVALCVICPLLVKLNAPPIAPGRIRTKTSKSLCHPRLAATTTALGVAV
jgi:hypothetical protein